MFRRVSRLWRSGGHTSGADSSSDRHTPDTSTPPGPQPAPSPARDSAPDYRGFHEGATGERISGWAWDRTRPDTPIDVDIYDGGTLLATVTADTFRQDLLNGRIGNGQHGFVYTPPASFNNGRTHAIWVRISGTDVDLKNTPKSIAPGNLSERYRGSHDRADAERISGWAWDSTRPNEPIDVDIYDGDTLLATVTADTFRQDLLDARIGNGQHAFVYTSPASLKDGRTHTIRVKVSGTDADLKNTPKAIAYNGAAPAYQGAHGRSDGTGIYGWAWDRSRPDEPVDVDIYDGDALLATVTANHFHQSLLEAGKGNGKHIFFYALPARLKDGRPHIIRVKIAGTSIELKNTPKMVVCTSE
jgi:hypothetical protein